MHAIRLEPASGAAPFPSAVWKHRGKTACNRVSHTSLLRQLSYRCIELSVRVSSPAAGNKAVYFGVHLGRQRLGKASRRGRS
jgi:hypothetical protein